MVRSTNKAEQLQWLIGAAIFLGALLSFLPFGAGAAGEQPLKVEFSHGSGVNPRHFERWECKLDSRSMKTETAEELVKLVNSTNIMSSKDSDYQTTEGGPFFSLEIETKQQKRKFNWSYEHAPASIQPLVKFLLQQSKKSVFEMGKQVQ